MKSMTPDTLVETALPPVPLTVEGASVLHQMMRFRWPAWRALTAEARAEIGHDDVNVFSSHVKRPREFGAVTEGILRPGPDG